MKHTKKYIFFGFFIAALFACLTQQQAYAQSRTRIHFLSLNDATDAILLESNGHFGMVDSGEDWDYPNSAKYPLREGITVDLGFEHQVIHYLEKLGVKKLDFYIATHAHSDHIGSGDEILRHFPTSRLYINEYDDSYMLDAHGKDPNDPYYVADAQENRLWDNQYVYDCLMDAARETGTQIITNLDLEENAGYRSFVMGDMSIEIMNYERERDTAGNIIPVSSENNNCLVTKITAFNRVALLTSDMEPLDGDTTKIALKLVEQLGGTGSAAQAGTAGTGDTSVTFDSGHVDAAEMDLPQNRSDTGNEITQEITDEDWTSIDDSKPNTGKTISLDLMKMCHHSMDYNNPTFFLTSLNPKNVVITGPMGWYSERERKCLPNAKAFSTNSSSAAVVADFTAAGLTVGYKTLSPEWYQIEGKRYYFDKCGRTLKGIQNIENKLYYFSEQGALETTGWVTIEKEQFYINPETFEVSIGWVLIDGKYYYFYGSGAMAKDVFIGEYYVDGNGVWIPGYMPERWIQSGNLWWYRLSDGSYPANCWKYINNQWYYFDANGWMVTGWLLLGDTWYYLDASGAMVTGWLLLGDTWYYLHESGAMATGWLLLGDTWYYLHGSGAMAIGWLLLGDTWYYLHGSGAMATGRQFIDGKYYNFGNNGQLL